MMDFILDVVTSKISFYLVIAYNIGLLVYLGVDILQDN